MYVIFSLFLSCLNFANNYIFRNHIKMLCLCSAKKIELICFSMSIFK